MGEPVPLVILTGGKDRRISMAYLEGRDTNFTSELLSPVFTDLSFGSSPTATEHRKSYDLESGRQSFADGKPGKDVPSDEVKEDPNIVSWDGPDDPENPLNWPERRKWGSVAIVAIITFITPLASSMFTPGIPKVLEEFHSHNLELSSFVVSVYVLGYAFGPLVIAPLSEMYGRLVIYHTCNIFFVIMTIACAVSSNFNMLIAFRFFEGTFGSAPLTIGAGTIADMIVQERRGGVMAIWALGPLMGPVIGPVVGGFVTQSLGWRWAFWLIAIVSGVITIAAFILLRETYHPTLLKRKTIRRRMETGNMKLRSKLDTGLTSSQLLRRSIVRPAKMLTCSPIVLALSTFMAVVYGYLYLLFTTLTSNYQDRYHFSQGIVGLTYLGIGLGSLTGVVVFGIASDRIVKRKAAAGVMKPEYRLPPMIPGCYLVPIGLLVYGWSAEKLVYWFVPVLGTYLVGLGILAIFMPIQTYLVDSFTTYAASAIAASTVLRSLLGAILPLAGRPLFHALGLGWGCTLLAFICFAMCPIPVVFYRYGERIRTSKRFQIDL